MNYYLKVYKAILRINFNNLLIYRANLINNIISSVSWACFSVFSILILTSKTPVILGWKREEIILLTGVFSIMIGIFNTFIVRNFEKISEIVNNGLFDFYLTSPIDSMFLASIKYISFTSIFRFFVGIGVIVYLYLKGFVVINVFNFFLFLVLLFLGLIILYSIWIIFISLTFKFTKLSNLPDFMYSFIGIGRYPKEMVKEFSELVFLFLLPITLIVNIPTKLLINKLTFSDIGYMILFSICLIFIARIIWLKCIRSYTSMGG